MPITYHAVRRDGRARALRQCGHSVDDHDRRAEDGECFACNAEGGPCAARADRTRPPDPAAIGRSRVGCRRAIYDPHWCEVHRDDFAEGQVHCDAVRWPRW